MKKILFLLFLLFIIDNVHAVDVRNSFYYDDEKVESMWITRVKGDKSASGNPYVLKRVGDNQYVYCLEPFAMLSKYEDYDGYYTNQREFNLSDEALEKINLYAYYGYQYPGHEDVKWYGITQYLIWKVIEPSADIYFTDSRFGNRIIAYETELNELETLVSKHNVIPSFNGKKYTDTYQKEIVITDTNNILDNYNIVDSNGLDIKKSSNQLIFNIDKIDTYHISLKQKELRNSNNQWILYYHESGQNVFLPGQINFNSAAVDLDIIGGYITLKKKDSDGISYPGTTLEGAQYGIYDGDVLVDVITTNSDGIAKSKILPIKNYTIKELSPSFGYQLDLSSYDIELTYDNTDVTIDVLEKVITNDILIYKEYSYGNTNIYYSESGAVFEIYDENYNLITTVTTDELGLARVALPFGKYIFHQIAGKDNFTFINDFEIIVNEESAKIQKLRLLDEEIEVPDTYQKEYTSMLAFIITIWGLIFLRHAKKTY